MSKKPTIEPSKPSNAENQAEGYWIPSTDKLCYNIFEEIYLAVRKVGEGKWEFELYTKSPFKAGKDLESLVLPEYMYSKKDYMGIKHSSHEIYRDLKQLINNGFDLRKRLAEIEINLSNFDARGGFEEKFEGEAHTFLNLPDWVLDDIIHSVVKVTKEVEGKKKIGLVRYYYDKKWGWARTDLLLTDRFIPTETGWTEEGFKNSTKIIPPFNDRLREVYYQLRSKIKEFVKFKEEIEYDIDTCASLISYFREVMDSYPIIDYYSARPGSGKTRAMKTLVWSCYHGFVTPINVTEAALFRSIEDAHSTIGIDEFHKLFYKNRDGELIATDSNKFAVINCGYTKGIMTYRVNMETKPPTVDSYDNFSLKAITRLGEIPSDLLSRCITHVMIKSHGNISGKEPHPDDFKEIRDKMYFLRIRLMDTMALTYSELLSSDILTDRIKDLFYPILTIAKHVDIDLKIFNQILEYAKKQEEEIELEQDIKIISLVRILIMENLVYKQKLKTITKHLNDELLRVEFITDEKYSLRSQKVSSLLQSIGFKKSSCTTDNLVHFDINPKILIINAISIFSYTLELPNLPNSPNDPPSEEQVRDLGEEEKLGYISQIRFCMGGPKHIYAQSRIDKLPEGEELQKSPPNKTDHTKDLLDLLRTNDEGTGILLESCKIYMKQLGVDFKVTEKMLERLNAEGVTYSPSPKVYRLLG